MYAKVYHWFESNILCHVLLLWEIEANVETPVSSKLRASHLRMRRLGVQPEIPIGNGLLVRIRNIYVDGYFYSENETMGALSTVTPAKVTTLRVGRKPDVPPNAGLLANTVKAYPCR